MNTSYSFSDVVFTISHPLVGQKIADGAGSGKIGIAYTDDLTISDLGADGAVMISKVRSRRGLISLDLQQTSPLNKWLLNYANAMDNASSSAWAGGSISIKEKFSNGVTTNASSVAITKRPDRNLAQAGDHVNWQFFSANIEEV